jgi:hypothetical protein
MFPWMRGGGERTMIIIQDRTADRLKSALRRSASFAAAVALSLGLGGCFMSQQPLFTEASAVAAVGDGGHYLAYEKIGNRYKRDEAVELRRHDNGYDYINEKGAVTPLTLHPLGKNLFAIQAKNESGGYVYARLRLLGNVGFVEVPDCDKQSLDKLRALGIVVRESELAKALTGRDHVQTHECLLDGVSEINKAFATIRFGAPTGKLVRQ